MPTNQDFTDISAIKSAITNCLSKDRCFLTQQFKQFNLKTDAQVITLVNNNQGRIFLQKLNSSLAQVAVNKHSVPKVFYDEKLPVAKRRNELFDLIKNNQVVVIAGETGSGKTTQIPKICLEAGRGVFGKIGCTQPRRLAARSVAQRIAEELGSFLGNLVGYQVRFHDLVQANSLIKVMTDGILLAEVKNDPFLNQYDTIIIDEAHERSINIDFLLGILKKILYKRKDLKLIITSATIDTTIFSKHFNNAPIIEVSGRAYPVELRYKPLINFSDDEGNEFEQDIPTAIVHVLDELALVDPFGDVLIFLVGERDIKETHEVLRKHKLKNTEITPLYARLSMAEQNKVFTSSTKRRIILSTNVAETSLTIPGIKFVIDLGQVRISRYSVRSKIQRLPIEKISQASANQRAGRCGRVSSGICVRLYDEEDFNSRPEFTPAEIHRTSLAAVILQMNVMKLGEVNNFPFIEPPEYKSVNDGLRQLQELGALDKNRRLTNHGRQLAKLPLEPRVAKMVMAGQDNAVLGEVLIIASFLSIQDPRVINEANRQAANKAYKQFEDERSDFILVLNLWRFYEDKRQHLSQNKLRKLCKINFLSYLRMKEWHDLFMQLKSSLKRSGIVVDQLHLYEEINKGKETIERLADIHSIAIHRSLLAGLLGNIATRNDDKSYLGARNTKLFLHPSSVLFKTKPKWILSAELIETTKLYARNNAKIDVLWVESIAPHLLKHNYLDPHWQKNVGQVSAYQSSSLYGLPIVNKRRCNYGLINPEEAHKIFLRFALVMGDMKTKLGFFMHNQKLIQEVKYLEAKLRRPDFLIDDEVLYEFYAEKIPQHIYSVSSLEKWVKKIEKQTPELIEGLFLEQSFLLKQNVNTNLELNFPDQITIKNSLDIAVDYHFVPGKEQDGLVVKIPLVSLNLINKQDFEWLTPGLIKEKTAFYIKSLPKQLRKQFVPVPQFVDLVHQQISVDKKGDYLTQMILVLNKKTDKNISLEDFANTELPSYLMPFYQLEDHSNKVLAKDINLDKLKENYQHLVEKQLKQTLKINKKSNKKITIWDFGDLKQQQEIKSPTGKMIAYPSLQITNQSIELVLIGDKKLAQQQHGKAVLKLLANNLADKVKYLSNRLPLQKACLCYAPYGTCQDLTKQIIDKSLNQLVANPELIKTQQEYTATLLKVKEKWILQAQEVTKQVNTTLISHQQIVKKVKVRVNPRHLMSIGDIKQQLDKLISKEFVLKTPDKWFKRFPFYLQAIEKRLDKIDIEPSKDHLVIRKISPLFDSYWSLKQQAIYENSEKLEEIRWQLEELRISLFAQPMKTLSPVSIKRIEKQIKEI